jgi:hypothetical protein
MSLLYNGSYVFAAKAGMLHAAIWGNRSSAIQRVRFELLWDADNAHSRVAVPRDSSIVIVLANLRAADAAHRISATAGTSAFSWFAEVLRAQHLQGIATVGADSVASMSIWDQVASEVIFAAVPALSPACANAA